MPVACIALGALVVLGAWLWPPLSPAWAFTDHMLRHMAVIAVGAALLGLGLARTRLPTIPPLLAAFLEFATVWGWHLPAAHVAAKTIWIALVAEQASFLAAGLALWLAVLRPGRELAGAGGMLLTSMHMTLLGALLILAGRALYPAAVCGGPADQQVGGMIMLGVGTPIYLIVGVVLTARALRGAERAA